MKFRMIDPSDPPRRIPPDLLHQTSFSTLSNALHHARDVLLAERTAAGHWEGELSTSALSTATALFALALYARATQGRTSPVSPEELEGLVRGGVRWLIEHQNADGGWGDTVLSLSNISTTALCWAALSVAGPEAHDTVRKAETWLSQAAGSLEPDRLARTIIARYGKDRTFSVPILTMCTLAGRLGKGREAWKHVPDLPFELAACPHEWFQWLQLPVVSYALPALIAIGQTIHHHRPTRNPAAYVTRELLRERTLGVLREIQPQGGGFLEAAPLTSFVTMSLVAAGHAHHPVVENAVDFLVRSVRPDGSWPIDTNLATWATTLSVNALAAGGDAAAFLSTEERTQIRDWLLAQQYREVHPYTRAAPGGWAWTDLPGGVPDADDTPGALLALRNLGSDDPVVRTAAAAGVTWLLGLQNRDGGIPTFCRGWGALPFDRSGADLTAHTLLAWNSWRDLLPPNLTARVDGASRSALDYLRAQQRADGAWIPLWFGNQHAGNDENPVYGTSRVLIALSALERSLHPDLERMRARGRDWLLSARNDDGSWGGERGVAGSIEETALAVHALAAFHLAGACSPQRVSALRAGVAWLAERTEGGCRFDPCPIGFYFARLWYFERLYPIIFTTAALGIAERALASNPAPDNPP